MKIVKSLFVIAFVAIYSLLSAQSDQFVIKNIGINSDQADFGTTYYKDKIVYVSTAEGVRGITRTWGGNSLPFLDMYLTDITDENELTNRKQFRKKVNKKYHDGPVSFSKSGDIMAFTRNNYEGKSSDEIVKLQLFYSDAADNGWTDPIGVHFNSKEYSVGQPSLTADGKTMYFASDMPGGMGSVDIYKVNRTTSGAWGKPINLGDKINTSAKEMFPFIHPSGILIFASNKEGSVGGLDIFYCEIKENGNFGAIKTFDEPINGPMDDFAMILNEDMAKGFFSSNRDGGNGDDDLYSFQMTKPLNFGKSIEGIVRDKNGNTIEGVEIVLKDENGNEVGRTTTSTDGSYSFSTDQNRNYQLSANKDQYLGGKEIPITLGSEQIIKKDLILESDPGFSLYGLITESSTGLPINDVHITLTNIESNKKETFVSSGNGDFLKGIQDKAINDNISYKIKIEKEGYLTKVVSYNRVLNKPGQINLHEEIDLTLFKANAENSDGNIFNINPIYFDLDDSKIRDDAAIELDKIVEIMIANPNLKLELGSYTDCRSTESYNLKLSQRRATASANYIKKRIDNPNRIYGKGYGESNLIRKDCECENDNEENDPCTNKMHEINRRTEFRILEL